ncbi:MAG: tRNA pseudouridine(38-40) synthase TruA [Abditibacteriota bacterium]|nr:tRNA pseudouridine(38-40) synthase TruA [Abditibacteriota bacterium]
MRNVRLILEYDGTAYSGFQRQPNGPTVQAALESAIKSVVGKDVTLYAAGRTDAGVHATGQVCSFLTDTDIGEEGLFAGINSFLPDDISVSRLEFADPDFHARYSAVSRHYSYRILNRRAPSALAFRYTWHVKRLLDPERMRRASGPLLGTHDFRSLANAGCADNTVRTVKSLSIHKDGDIIYIDIEADGFLRSMVRNIAGLLTEVGLGKREPEAIEGLLEKRDRRLAGLCAPAKGLFFTRVDY